jgi:hypothetical protein
MVTGKPDLRTATLQGDRLWMHAQRERRRLRPRLSATRNMAAKKSGASGERADSECRTLREVRQPE